jgi:hypothetical protein
MKKFVLIAAAALPLLAAPASACNVIGHSSDGEPLCGTTSDGAGQPYTDARRGRLFRDRSAESAPARAERQRIDKMKVINLMSHFRL